MHLLHADTLSVLKRNTGTTSDLTNLSTMVSELATSFLYPTLLGLDGPHTFHPTPTIHPPLPYQMFRSSRSCPVSGHLQLEMILLQLHKPVRNSFTPLKSPAPVVKALHSHAGTQPPAWHGQTALHSAAINNLLIGLEFVGLG